MRWRFVRALAELHWEAPCPLLRPAASVASLHAPEYWVTQIRHTPARSLDVARLDLKQVSCSCSCRCSMMLLTRWFFAWRYVARAHFLVLCLGWEDRLAVHVQGYCPVDGCIGTQGHFWQAGCTFDTNSPSGCTLREAIGYGLHAHTTFLLQCCAYDGQLQRAGIIILCPSVCKTWMRDPDVLEGIYLSPNKFYQTFLVYSWVCRTQLVTFWLHLQVEHWIFCFAGTANAQWTRMARRSRRSEGKPRRTSKNKCPSNAQLLAELDTWLLQQAAGKPSSVPLK